MKRYSEVVLNGHPDKFCDLVADRLIREICKTDPGAYAQIEVAVWSDMIFMTGGVVTGTRLAFPVEGVIRELGREIGYTADNHIDVERYRVMDHICWLTGDPGRWTSFSNDQCIVTGYAGYDRLTRFLPPEHFIAWHFREKLIKSLQEGPLKGQGPDGKILVVMDEGYGEWRLAKVLVTLQQQESVSFMDFTNSADEVLRDTWRQLRLNDHRWQGEWEDVLVLVNPNGPLVNGGSDGDNGQTGRKLVMDFYGPRVPVGGGALYGKHLSHIDRLAAMMARKFAVELVAGGSDEALVRVCFAPGIDIPLCADITSSVKPATDPQEFFSFDSMKKSITVSDLDYSLTGLGSFYNPDLSFNNPG